jgi:hypothetical protein
MSADSMSIENGSELASTGTASPVSTMAAWIAALASDVSAIIATCEQLSEAAPLRAPLRAGLRHLVHIHPLCEGIEGLAMLEVALVLRVTTLLAQPAEELGDETVLRLRAETGLIEELFPGEREALWTFCARLIDQERRLDSDWAEPQTSVTPTSDPLLERARVWTVGYVGPAFGGHSQELTRARAFVKNRAQTWST